MRVDHHSDARVAIAEKTPDTRGGAQIPAAQTASDDFNRNVLGSPDRDANVASTAAKRHSARTPDGMHRESASSNASIAKPRTAQQLSLLQPGSGSPTGHRPVRRDTTSTDARTNDRPPPSPSVRTDESRTLVLVSLDPQSISAAAHAQFHDFSQAVKRIKEQIPADVRRQTANFIRDTIRQRAGIDVDPDRTYVLLFDGAEASGDGNDGVTGYQHVKADVKRSWTLTDFVIGGFDDAWRDSDRTALNTYFGLYNGDPDAAAYRASNQVPILPSDLRAMLDDRARDLERNVYDALDAFWSTHAYVWRALAKTEFSALARKAFEDGQLSPSGYRLAMKGAAPNVPLKGGATFEQMKSDAAPDGSVQVRHLDINGYSSTDILQFSAADGSQVLYVPGEVQSFHEFADERKLKDWVISEARDPAARNRLETHFAIYERSKGSWGALSKTGVKEGLQKLGSGSWGHDGINTRAAAVSGDVFADMTERTRLRVADDLLEAKRGGAKRQMWLDDLNNTRFTPFATPLARALLAGSFAGGVASGAYERFVDSSGLDAALTMLFAPHSLWFSDAERQPAPVPNAGPVKQGDFLPVDFPARNATQAINQINETMRAITGQRSPAVYHSLAEVKESGYGRKDPLGVRRVENSLEEVHRRLAAANERLHDDEEKGHVFVALAKSLNTKDRPALQQAYQRMRELALEALERFDLFRDFGYTNITFFRRSDDRVPLPEQQQNDPTAAFVDLRDRNRLMINLDTPDSARHSLAQTDAERGYNVELVDSIIAQLTRVAGNTQYFVSVQKEQTNDGFSLATAATALDQFQHGRPGDALCHRTLGKAPDFPDDATVQRILGIADDQRVTDDMRVNARFRYQQMNDGERKRIERSMNWTYADKDRHAVVSRIQRDDVLRADLITSNAESAAILLRDIADRRDPEAPLPRADDAMRAGYAVQDAAGTLHFFFDACRR